MFSLAICLPVPSLVIQLHLLCTLKLLGTRLYSLDRLHVRIACLSIPSSYLELFEDRHFLFLVPNVYYKYP